MTCAQLVGEAQHCCVLTTTDSHSRRACVSIHVGKRLMCSAAAQLVDEAHHRWLVEEEGVVDDITAVVVMFNHAA